MRISKAEFFENWQDAKKFKTNPFKLCRHVPPDSLNKWIPQLEYMSDYSEFSRPGSSTDLELYCKVIIMTKYEAILKINVRPNLEVVLQLGSLERSTEEIDDKFKLYMETLELMMKEMTI